MKLGIAQAYNGEHKVYRKNVAELGAKAFLFDIDTAKWLENLKPADAYIWHADAKEENYRIIHDRVYAIEHILKKKIYPDMNMYFAYGDKIKEDQLFKHFKIPTPKTYITYDKNTALKMINGIKYPFVIKDAHGYGGIHVYLIKNKKEAGEMIEKIFSSKGLKHGCATMKNYLLAQEYIEIEKDLRVIVIGNQVVCAYWRSSESDWRHNINQGAVAHFAGIPKKALDLCLEFNRKMKFHWMSYDLFITGKNKILMNEYACNFGIKAPTEAGYDIRKMQVEYILKRIKR